VVSTPASFIFRRTWVQISVQRPAKPSEVFGVFPQSLHLIPGQHLKLDHDCFLPHPFQFVNHYSLIILSLDEISPELLIMSLNKSQINKWYPNKYANDIHFPNKSWSLIPECSKYLFICSLFHSTFSVTKTIQCRQKGVISERLTEKDLEGSSHGLF
jgi:hypothetical protein